VISGISSMAMSKVLAELSQRYEKSSGQAVSVLAVGGVDAARRVEHGEGFDFVVLAADAIERLSAAGRVDAASRTDLARSDIAVAVPAGAARPDLSSEATLRQAILSGGTIGYSTGPSGTHLLRLFERWRIAERIAPRMVQAPPGVPVGALVARGEASLGFQQSSEFIDVAGIDVVGLLPPEIRMTTVFTGAVCTASREPAATRALLAYLASAEGEATKRRHGMEPATSPS